jgi:hypothetical protein
MYRPIIELDDDDDGKRVLKPGETVRVRLPMMDGHGGKSIIDEFARRIFGGNHGEPDHWADHYEAEKRYNATLTDAERAAERARTARNVEISNAWRNPSRYPFEDNKPASTTFELTTPVTDARGRAEEAREKRLEMIANAWRFAR